MKEKTIKFGPVNIPSVANVITVSSGSDQRHGTHEQQTQSGINHKEQSRH